MLLHFTQSGPVDGKVVILLHGLFAMGSSLAMVAKPLTQHYCVYSLDLRNHGRSFRAESMSLTDMAEDVLMLMDDQGIGDAYLLGHSLGGKVAMQLALQQPKRVRALVVADIAPVAYAPGHQAIFAGLKAVDLAAINNRRDADKVMASYIAEQTVRSFLLTNLYRDSEGGFAWRMDSVAIERCYEQLRRANDAHSSYLGSTLFIKGQQSDYIQQRYYQATIDLFPAATFKVLQNAGHWLHAEKTTAFNRLVENFLSTQ